MWCACSPLIPAAWTADLACDLLVAFADSVMQELEAMTVSICRRRAARAGLTRPWRVGPALLGTVVAAAASLAGCGPGGSTTGSVAVDLDDLRQTIDGFGAADAFLRAPLTADQNALFWDP